MVCLRTVNIVVENADKLQGVTPFVDPDNLRYFFEEIHRLATAEGRPPTTP